jgi:hypothetical protein
MIARLKTLIPCAVILLSLSATCAHASSIIVNLDAVTNSYNTDPIAETLAAGTYTVTPIDPAEGGAYTAWNYYTYLNVWQTGYVIAADYSGSQVVLVYTGFFPTYSTATDAFANADSSTFTLTGTTVVDFGVADSYYPDNQGGVSLLVSDPAPEPGTLVLMGTGLAGLGFMLMRRTKVQTV